MSEITEEEDAASERRKVPSLVDCCQMEKPFLDFFFYLFQLGISFCAPGYSADMWLFFWAWADVVMDIGQMLSSL